MTGWANLAAGLGLGLAVLVVWFLVEVQAYTRALLSLLSLGLF